MKCRIKYIDMFLVARSKQVEIIFRIVYITQIRLMKDFSSVNEFKSKLSQYILNETI